MFFLMENYSEDVKSLNLSGENFKFCNEFEIPIYGSIETRRKWQLGTLSLNMNYQNKKLEWN